MKNFIREKEDAKSGNKLLISCKFFKSVHFLVISSISWTLKVDQMTLRGVGSAELKLFNITPRKKRRVVTLIPSGTSCETFTSLLWETYFYYTSFCKRSSRDTKGFCDGNSGHADYLGTLISALVKVSRITFVSLLLRYREDGSFPCSADAKNLSRSFAKSRWQWKTDTRFARVRR